MKKCLFVLSFLLAFDGHLFPTLAAGDSTTQARPHSDDDRDRDDDDNDREDDKDHVEQKAAYFRGVLVKAELKLERSKDKDDDNDKRRPTLHLVYTFRASLPQG